jgi:hypothetical protein
VGRESKLRGLKDDVPTETRWSYSDGTRKLYDRDKMPEGLDPDIWDCALYFEQVAESNRISVEGRPILYTELAHRVRTCGITGMFVKWIDAIKDMIDLYYDYPKDRYSINDFCSIETFNYSLSVVVQDYERAKLLKEGIRIPQVDRDKKPVRRGAEEEFVASVLTTRYTPEELVDKMKNWKLK